MIKRNDEINASNKSYHLRDMLFHIPSGVLLIILIESEMRGLQRDKRESRDPAGAGVTRRLGLARGKRPHAGGNQQDHSFLKVL